MFQNKTNCFAIVKSKVEGRATLAVAGFGPDSFYAKCQ